jgi:hypothetical protein
MRSGETCHRVSAAKGPEHTCARESNRGARNPTPTTKSPVVLNEHIILIFILSRSERRQSTCTIASASSGPPSNGESTPPSSQRVCPEVALRSGKWQSSHRRIRVHRRSAAAKLLSASIPSSDQWDAALIGGGSNRIFYPTVGSAFIGAEIVFYFNNIVRSAGLSVDQRQSFPLQDRRRRALSRSALALLRSDFANNMNVLAMPSRCVELVHARHRYQSSQGILGRPSSSRIAAPRMVQNGPEKRMGRLRRGTGDVWKRRSRGQMRRVQHRREQVSFDCSRSLSETRPGWERCRRACVHSGRSDSSGL